MNLESMLSERSQSQKTTYYSIYMKCLEYAHLWREKVEIHDCLWLGELGEVTPSGHGVFLGDHENILKVDCGGDM